MTPIIDPKSLEDIAYFALRYLGNLENIPTNTSMELANTWRKHVHQLNEDDLESCSHTLLNELINLPQIPHQIGDKLGEAYQHYLNTKY